MEYGVTNSTDPTKLANERRFIKFVLINRNGGTHNYETLVSELADFPLITWYSQT